MQKQGGLHEETLFIQCTRTSCKSTKSLQRHLYYCIETHKFLNLKDEWP